MYPDLIQIGSVTVSSYSVMVTIAYLIGYIFLGLEVKRKGLDDSLADWVLLAILFG